MKAEKTVDVTVNYCDEDEPAKVGYYKRFRPVLKDNKWIDSDEEEIVFGYVTSDGYMTQMCYSELTSGVDNWEELAVTGKHARKWDRFYFDAGGNGRPLYIMREELQRAMHELGLISDDAVKYCKNCSHSKLIHAERGECEWILDESDSYEENCPCAAFISLQGVGDKHEKEDDAP